MSLRFYVDYSTDYDAQMISDNLPRVPGYWESETVYVSVPKRNKMYLVGYRNLSQVLRGKIELGGKTTLTLKEINELEKVDIKHFHK